MPNQVVHPTFKKVENFNEPEEEEEEEENEEDEEESSESITVVTSRGYAEPNHNGSPKEHHNK